ncbi:MAG: methyltransferase family protein [Chloroflexota bacterium]
MKLTLPNLFVALQLILFAALLGSFVAFPVAEGAPVLRLIGLVWVFVGIWYALAGIRQHGINDGVNISPTPRHGARLIQTGMYASVRHPIYAGVIITGLGAALVHGHPAPLVIGLLFIPFFTFKSLYEESLLRQTYSEYDSYIERTGRFLPPWRQK